MVNELASNLILGDDFGSLILRYLLALAVAGMVVIKAFTGFLKGKEK